MTDHEHDNDNVFCPLCDGTPEQQRQAADALAAHLAPILADIAAQRELPKVIIPRGLSRDGRRQFLTDNQIGALVLDEMSQAEFDDWLDDPVKFGNHATVAVPDWLDTARFKRMMFGD